MRRLLRAARNMKRSPGTRRPDVHAKKDFSSAHRRKVGSHFKWTHPYKLSRSAWDVHALLTYHLERRGFNGASFIALRVMSEGVESALSTVLLSFHWALEDVREEIEGANRGRSFDLRAVGANPHKQRSKSRPRSAVSY